MAIDESFHEPYREYAATLRTWLVGYGVGAPVLFLTQKSISEAIRRSGSPRLLISLFLIGVGLQVVVTLLNKWNNWYLYAKKPEEGVASAGYAFCEALSDRWWIDAACDVTSIVAFVWATALGMSAVLNPDA